MYLILFTVDVKNYDFKISIFPYLKYWGKFNIGCALGKTSSVGVFYWLSAALEGDAGSELVLREQVETLNCNLLIWNFEYSFRVLKLMNSCSLCCWIAVSFPLFRVHMAFGNQRWKEVSSDNLLWYFLTLRSSDSLKSPQVGFLASQ